MKCIIFSPATVEVEGKQTIKAFEGFVNDWLASHPDVEIVNIFAALNSGDALVISLFYKEKSY